jgi:hypothetical protein
MEIEPPRDVCIVSGRTGRFNAAGTAIGRAVGGTDARIDGVLLVVCG